MIPPKSCPMAKMNDEISIAGIIPVLIFNLLNKTPLKTNSSTIGANIMDAIASSMRMLESISTVSMSHIESNWGHSLRLKNQKQILET